MNTRLTKGNIQTPNKDARNVLVRRETEVKTTKRCDHTLPSETRVKKIKRQTLARTWSSWNLHTKWCSHLGGSADSFL